MEVNCSVFIRSTEKQRVKITDIDANLTLSYTLRVFLRLQREHVMFKTFGLFALFIIWLISFCSIPLQAESQGNDYKGITDPFGDPSNYEFSDDEREDKEFFHLGRYLMLGVDLGVGLYTGGLGKITSPGFLVGGKLIYFFDKSIAFEGAMHYTRQTKTLPVVGAQAQVIDTTLIPITGAFRYYFDVKSAPKAIAVANPYLVGGGGVYMRSENNLTGGDSAATNSFGALFGGGAEFNIYRKHIYLGVDLRYHFIFFPDEDITTYDTGTVEPGTNSGDYFSSLITITFNF